MIRESPSPYLRARFKFPLHPKTKPAFDELYSAFQRSQWRDEQMKMIRHQNEFMQKISLTAMREKILEK